MHGRKGLSKLGTTGRSGDTLGGAWHGCHGVVMPSEDRRGKAAFCNALHGSTRHGCHGSATRNPARTGQVQRRSAAHSVARLSWYDETRCVGDWPRVAGRGGDRNRMARQA